MKVPNRTGEGFAGIDHFGSNSANLSDMLNMIALSLAEIKAASQLLNFSAFKAAAADIGVLEKSDDSRI